MRLLRLHPSTLIDAALATLDGRARTQTPVERPIGTIWDWDETRRATSERS